MNIIKHVFVEEHMLLTYDGKCSQERGFANRAKERAKNGARPDTV